MTGRRPSGGGRGLSAVFRSLATLRALNVIAVGASLAAATGVFFARVFGPTLDVRIGAVTAATTLAFGLVWAMLLRARATIGRSRLRWGWAASVPLAAANGATACALLFMLDKANPEAWLIGAMLGATIGAMFWVPGLLATLICFGLPIAWSQRLASKGLAGEERGEIVVGAASAVIALTALALLLTASGDGAVTASGLGPVMLTACYAVVEALALVGAATGATAAILAHLRESARRAFVRSVEAGAVAGFRVDATTEGKVLVRITSLGEGYRVANFEEPLYGLDEAGRARRAMGG